MSTHIKEWECPEVFECFLNWLDAGREQPGVSMMPSTVENSGTLFTLTRSDFADIRKRKEKENPGRIAQITAACFCFR